MTAQGAARSRWSGVVVVGLAILVAVASRALVPILVNGAAVPYPVPGPPSIGDCVNEPIDPTAEKPYLVYDGTGGPSTTASYNQVAMGSCGASRFGEVSMIIAQPPVPAVKVRNIQSEDPNLATCSAAASAYVGLAADGVGFTPTTAGWSSVIQTPSTLSRPTARQLAAGQHWLACIVYPGASAADPTSYADQETYRPTLREAVAGGPGKDLLGTCFAETDFRSNVISCTQPHRGEMFAWGSAESPTARTKIETGCRESVRLMTGTSSFPTGLTIATEATNTSDQLVTAATISAHTELACGVISTRALAGSLLGVGTGPIPWH